MISKETRIKMSASKKGDLNPMKKMSVRLKSSESHKGNIPWNKNLIGDDYTKHYKNNKIKGGRPKGYKHTLISKQKMSQNMIGKKHKVTWSIENRKKCAKRMKKNRQDFLFNLKMFQSLQKNISNPHRKVKSWINNFSSIKTISNYPIYIGNKYAEIDEANIEDKIAIFVDGNYWHNYPNFRKWDKIVTTCLLNKGWKVYRFWESDINKNPEEVILHIKSIAPFLQLNTNTQTTTTK